jgi:hypothetical protein
MAATETLPIIEVHRAEFKTLIATTGTVGRPLLWQRMLA